jgi:diguanylate cyclase (GGDEF)-like protein
LIIIEAMQIILSILLFTIAAFLTGYSVYALKSRSLSQISHSFAGLMLALAVYAAGYAGELLSGKLTHMVFWSTFQYLGISFIPFLWITLTAQYINAPFIRNKAVRMILPGLSCITLFGALTDPWLHLKYASVGIGMDPGFPVLAFVRGPLFYFQSVYMLSSFMTGIVLLVCSLLSTGKKFLKPVLLIITGSSLPFIDFILYLINIRIPGIDTIPFCMFFSVLCSGFAVFSESLLDTVPVARSLVFSIMSDAVIVVDHRNKITDYNTAAVKLFPGITEGILPVTGMLTTTGIPEETEFETDILCSGEKRRFSCRVTNIPAVQGKNKTQGNILLFKDITDSVLLLRKMEELATIDPLTGLYNRRYFMTHAEQTTAALKRTNGMLSFIIADLDLFKQINDTRGHPAGDAVIQATAAVFKASVRPPNIAARFGGEEFICLLPNTDADTAYAVAEQIRNGIARIPFPEDDNSDESTSMAGSLPGKERLPYITASFGVASAEAASDEQTISQLASRADKALYKSKNTGRNRTTIG